ncbi:hypothetical protein [Flavobacterium sp.]|uniref:hypothetical protein n=1 Tax=Flavobacterium sp. TaxID=239 RepID=UPI002620EE61|nr:hypothetical protein [Flavobacterium sp.]
MKNFKLKNVLSILFLFVLVTTLVSCKSPSVVLPTKTETITNSAVKEVIRDTVFEVKKDSSYYKAWLECVDGQIKIKENTKPKFTKGKYLQPPKVLIKGNELTVDCEAEAQRLFAQWKDTFTEKNTSTTTEIPVLVEKDLSWWQETQIWCGRIFLGILALFFIAIGLRLTKVI